MILSKPPRSPQIIQDPLKAPTSPPNSSQILSKPPRSSQILQDPLKSPQILPAHQRSVQSPQDPPRSSKTLSRPPDPPRSSQILQDHLKATQSSLTGQAKSMMKEGSSQVTASLATRPCASDRRGGHLRRLAFAGAPGVEVYNDFECDTHE